VHRLVTLAGGALREDVQHLLARNGDPVRLIYSSSGAGGRPACVMQNSTALSFPSAMLSL
jgi:phenylacetate-coenzyme A ligase PaaK-like adenylate-forming protein